MERDWFHEDSVHREKLDKLIAMVEASVRDKDTCPSFTDHTERHFKAVEKACRLLLGDRPNLNQKERFLLIAAAWTHDIGMVQELEGWQRVPDDVLRDTHHERSCKYVREHGTKVGLGDLEVIGLTSIIAHHRRRTKLSAIEENIAGVRLRLITAYLRLADAVSRTRDLADTRLFERIRDLSNSLTTTFHHLKSIFVADVIAVPEEHKIVLVCPCSDEDRPWARQLVNIIAAEIQEEIWHAQHEIVRGDLPKYLEVEGKVIPGNVARKYEVDLRQIVGNLKLGTGTAGEAFDTLVGSLIDILGCEKPPHELRNAVVSYQRDAIRPTCDKRSCHVLLGRVRDMVQEWLDSTGEAVDAATITAFRELLKARKADRDSRKVELVENAQTFFKDGQAVLVFGMSTLVAEILHALPAKIRKKLPVFVMECRAVTRIDAKGETQHCDGVEYALLLAKKLDNVTLVPDQAVGYLMEHGMVEKVAIGANGIGVEDARLTGHTLGHHTVANLARLYDIPVFVCADVLKFGDFMPDATLRRERSWLAGDRKTREVLDDAGIQLFNPREDTVSPDCVKMFVTDKGAFQPSRMPKKFEGGWDAEA